MLEIIALFVLGFQISKLAARKAEKQWPWVLRMLFAWIGFELLGIILAMGLLEIRSFFNLALIGLMSGIGGYLLTKYQLEKLPDADNNLNDFGKPE